MSGTAGLTDKANRAWSVSASGGHSDSPAPTAKLATLGAFAQVLGRIAGLDDKGRARVLLEIMGGAVAPTLERAALERA